MTKPHSVSSTKQAEPPRRRLRIVAHNGGIVFGGGEKAVAGILAGLAARGHDVVLYCRNTDVAQQVAAAGVPAHVFALGGDLMLHHAERLARAVRRRHADVLLLTTFRKFLIGGIAGRLARLPVVGRIGIETDIPDGLKYAFTFRYLIDRVVFNAESMRQRFLSELPSYPPDRALTLVGGVQDGVKQNYASSLRSELHIPEAAHVIGSAGRLARAKRFDRLLAVTAGLPGVHCVVAGRGVEMDVLRAKAQSLGIADRVHLLGWRQDIGSVIGAFDVYLVTSDKEGMSNAMLEALAAGVPVVSTPVSGAREALEPLPDGRRPGVVVDFDERALRDAVCGMLADEATRRATAAAARERAAERFTYARMIDRWETLLAELAGRA